MKLHKLNIKFHKGECCDQSKKNTIAPVRAVLSHVQRALRSRASNLWGPQLFTGV